MTLANRLTWLRIILAPVFFAVYFLPEMFGGRFFSIAPWTIPALWIIAIIAEFTDMFDGMAARHQNEVSDFGKFFDPFADTLFQITAFLCFVIAGLFPPALFLVVIYREYGILFIRNLLLKKGIALGARKSGKLKTVIYITAGGIALLYESLIRLSAFESFQPTIRIIAVIAFYISVAFAVISFFDYYLFYRKANKTKS